MLGECPTMKGAWPIELDRFTTDRYIPGEFPDTGVRNGRLLPGQLAKTSAWLIVLAVIALPVIF